MRKLLVYMLLLTTCNVYSQYHEWTWIHGDSAKNSYGIYNIQGVSDLISHPGARYAQVNWQDTTNNFWIYGGGYYNFSPNSANNMWRYEPATNEWTWMHGADTIGNWARIYGVKGVANPANHPGSRGFGVLHSGL